MKPTFEKGNVKAYCPDCKAITTFEFQSGGSEFGSHIINEPHMFKGSQYSRLIYKLLRCAGCGRGGLAKIHLNNKYVEGFLEDFLPYSVEHSAIPSGVPEGISKEFQEAELCASAKAWRAGSAMLRSVLEKTLKLNGYEKKQLA